MITLVKLIPHCCRKALLFLRPLMLLCALCLPAAGAQQEEEIAASLRLEGVVFDQAGAPVSGAEVALRRGAPPIDAAHAVTDADGRFVLEPGAGAGTLIVRARGFAVFEQEWRADQTAPGRVEIVLSPPLLAEEVTVTATRTETNLSETAASVRVLSAAEIAATAAVTLDDALRQVPGFQLFRRAGSRTANPTSQGVSLRGVGASGASRALVLADQIPLNDPFGGWVYWGRVPRAAIGRAEVLRGAASSLYGSAALGGVVQIITRRAEAAPALALEISYGNRHTPEASLFLSGQWRGWGASLAAEAFRSDGHIIVAEQERGPIDTPATVRRASALLTLERIVAEGKRLFVRGSFYTEERDNGTPLQTNHTSIRQLVAGSDWQTARAGVFSLRAYGGPQVYDQNFSAVFANRAGETLTRVQRVPAQSVGVTAQWSRVLGAGRHAVVAGFDAREVRGASDEIGYASGRPVSLTGAGGRERSLGLFAQDTLRLTSRLFATAGARFDRWRNTRGLQQTRPLTPTGTPALTVFPDRTETAFSPQLSLLYRPSETLTLAASAARAFRAPTLNELYRSFRVGDTLTLANEGLRAERLTGGEAGVGLTTLRRRLDLRATVFWAEITRPVSNVTVGVTPSLVTRQRQNLGRTRSRGAEIETEARLTRQLTVSGGYSFTDATVLRFPASTALEGLRLPQVPRHYVSFQARYVNSSVVTFGLQGRATSAQFDDDQNRFRLRRYFTLDAIAQRRLARGADIFVAAENLLNRRYDVGRTPVLTIGPPLLVRFGLRLRLGSR